MLQFPLGVVMLSDATLKLNSSLLHGLTLFLLKSFFVIGQ